MGDGADAGVRWQVYLQLGRVSNLPTVWTNVLAGTALAGRATPAAHVAVLAVACSLFYVGGMYLNDAFDREVDARERSERPIPAGQIGAGAVFAIGFGLLAAALVVLAAASAWWGGGRLGSVGAGLVLAGGITYYDAHHKANPWSPGRTWPSRKTSPATRTCGRSCSSSPPSPTRPRPSSPVRSGP